LVPVVVKLIKVVPYQNSSKPKQSDPAAPTQYLAPSLTQLRKRRPSP
jgi:hypothetical protein